MGFSFYVVRLFSFFLFLVVQMHRRQFVSSLLPDFAGYYILLFVIVHHIHWKRCCNVVLLLRVKKKKRSG